MSVNKNGKAYDSGDVRVFINSIPINVKEISYSSEQEHQVNHSLSNYATSFSQGKVSHSGSITLFMEDACSLEEAAPGGDLMRIEPFDINVTFTNEFNKVVNDTLTAKFKNQGREINGDMGLNKQYELLVLDIQYNNL